MSYSLGAWDQPIPTAEGAAPQTYRYVVSAVRNLPSGSAALVPERVALFLRNAGFEYYDVRWGSGGTLVLQYRAPRGTPAYGSGVERRRMVEGALQSAAHSLGPSVVFGPAEGASLSSTARTIWPWVLGGAGLLLVGTLAFAAGTSAEGVRRERVRANRRRRRR